MNCSTLDWITPAREAVCAEQEMLNRVGELREIGA